MSRICYKTLAVNAYDPKSWILFLSHSRRVRSLLTKWTSDDLAYLEILHRCRPDQDIPLLPGVQDLSFLMVDSAVDIIFLIQALVQPNLQTLRIVYLVKCVNPPSFELLSLKAPRIQKLQVKLIKLADTAAGVATNESLVSTLPGLNYLTNLLYINSTLPAPVLLHLGRLPNLRVLNISICSESVSSLIEGDHTLFPNLGRLWLTGVDASHIVRLLEAISSSSLDALYLLMKVQPSSALLARCVDLAARHPHLSHFNVHYSREVRVRMRTTPEYIVHDVALQPLLNLPCLTTLGLRDTPLQLNDTFLHDLATSCRQLRELILGTSVRQRPSGLTMEGLRPLASHCPKLFLLAVTFTTPPAREITLKSKLYWVLEWGQQSTVANDASLDPNLQMGQEAAGRSTSLKLLDIGSSHIHDPEAVAAFITRYFPNVQEVSDLWDLFSSHKNMHKLNKLIRKWGRERRPQGHVEYNSRPLAVVLFSETAPLMN